MGLFDGGDAAEFAGQLGKALFLGLLGKGIVHIGPLVVFTLGGVQQILGGIAQLAQGLEPHLGVFLFILGGFGKDLGDLLIALFFGDAGKVGVFIAGLGFPSKSGPQVLFGFCTFQFHGNSSFHAVGFGLRCYYNRNSS